MKRILIVAITLLAFSSCFKISRDTNNEENIVGLKDVKIIDYSDDLHLYEIDSCEYIGSMKYQNEMLTHKGNCKYCLQRNKVHERFWVRNGKRN